MGELCVFAGVFAQANYILIALSISYWWRDKYLNRFS